MNRIFAAILAFGLFSYAQAFADPQGATLELKDGTQIEVSANNEVSVINADGSKTPAPDGVHVLKNGGAVTTKDGKKVAE